MQYMIGSMTSGFLVMHDRVDASLHRQVRLLGVVFSSVCLRVQDGV